MSVEAMTWVSQLPPEATATTFDRFVLMALANYADPEGGNAWPKVATVCQWVGLPQTEAGKRRVRKALQALETAGLIEREVQEGGARSMPDHVRPNVYALAMSYPQGGHIDPPPPVTGDLPPRSRVTPLKTIRKSEEHCADEVDAVDNPHLFDPPPPPKAVRKTRPPTKHQELFQAVARACGLDPERVKPAQRTHVGKIAAQLAAADATPDDVRKVRKWWGGTFRAKDRTNPSLGELGSNWEAFHAAACPPAPDYWTPEKAAEQEAEEYQRFLRLTGQAG